MTGVILDGVLIALLMAALLFGLRLDAKLKSLKTSQEAFAKAVNTLDSAAIRAHQSLKELRKDADESQELLHGRVLAGREVLQKLELRLERAERLSNDLAQREIALKALKDDIGRMLDRPMSVPAPKAVATQRPPIEPREKETPRTPFAQDVIKPTAESLKARGSVLKDLPPRPSSRRALPESERLDDEALDKIHMSELVVANINALLNNLGEDAPPKRRGFSDDDLFEAPKKR